MELDPGDRTPGGRSLIALFALAAILAAVDLAADVGEGTALVHAVLELGVIAAGLSGVAMLAVGLTRSRRRERALHADLARVSEEAERWRERAGDLLRGLGETIDEQLQRWSLTPAEKEVALLLLKGLSSKEIAGVREVAESTIRQQSRAIYRKTGLAGRRELAAFFLEDLLLPTS